MTDLERRDEPRELGQTLIALGGLAGAQTNDLATQLAADYATTRTAFADHLRGLAKKEKRPENYPVLQEIGIRVIQEQGWEKFCAWVWRPTAFEEVAIVDGLRHVDAVRRLRQLARPNNVYVLYVDVSREEQYQNIELSLEKQNLPRAMAQQVIDHPVEAESAVIRYVADRVVKDAGEHEEAIKEIKSLIVSKRAVERGVLRTRTELPPLIFSRIEEDVDRYESLREIARLLQAMAGAEPIGAWLRTPRLDLDQRAPIDILLRGEPGEAIHAALRTLRGS